MKKALPDAFLDCHLMVSDPAKWVEPLKEAGGDQMVFHYEAEIENIEDLIQDIKNHGMKVGLAVKPKTPVDDTLMDLLRKDIIDMFLVMTVEPGFGGQSFIGILTLLCDM